MIQYILFSIFSGLLVILFRHYKKRKYIYECLKSIKGPPTKFFFGNVLQFGSNPVEFLANMKKTQDIYGPICKYFVGPSKVYVSVSDPELIEILLNSQKKFTKGIDYGILKPWLHNGLLLSSGKYWQKRRKIITPTFHFKILDDFIPTFNYESDVLVQKLLPEVGKDVVNIHQFVTSFTLDSLCETAMGTTINAQNSPIDNKYLNAIKIMCGMYVKRRFSPWKTNNFLFQFSNDFKTQSEALNVIHGFTKSVIEKRRNDLVNQGENKKETTDDTGVKKKTVFLDILLKSTVDGEGLSDADILEEVETFMFAGHDTTASAISFTLYEIAHNPRIQDKIIEELKDIFAVDGNRQPCRQDFNNMKYLDLVIKEALRKYPTVPYISRKLEEDLEYKGTIIPKGVNVTAFIYHMHNRPDLFKNPEEFNPDRFLLENLNQTSHFAYVPFSAGPRNCIGQRFAMIELKSVLSKILRNFKLLPADSKYNVVLSAQIILKAADGVSIRLEKRHF